MERFRRICEGVYRGVLSTPKLRDKGIDLRVRTLGDIARVEIDARRAWINHSYLVADEGRVSYGGNIKIDDRLAGKGIGRLLADAREEAIRRAGGGIIVINRCETVGFWEHMGYAPAPRQVSALLAEQGIKTGSAVHYKLVEGANR